MERSSIPIRRFSDRKQLTVCRILCRHLSKVRKMWKRDLHLTVNCMWQDVSLNRLTMILTWCSLSSRTIVYKGMFLVGQLRTFFADLQEPDYESAIATVHSRFSTRTRIQAGRERIRTVLSYITVRSTPSGEMRTRCLPARKIWSPQHLKGELQKVLPVVNRGFRLCNA